MAERIERSYPGVDARSIYDRLIAQLDEVAKSYGLKLECDDSRLAGRVHKRGMVDVSFAALDEKLAADVDFGMLIPGPIREKIRAALDERLDGLFG